MNGLPVSPNLRTSWPALRALLIAAALATGGLSGIPEPPSRELKLAPEVLQTAYAWVQAVQDAILPKMQFVPATLQFSQRWKLFSSAKDSLFLIRVEARADQNDSWELLYTPHDPEHAWEDWTIEYRRVRGNWNPSRQGANPGYPAFVTWVARRAFKRETRWHTVRVRMEEVELLPLGKGFRPTGNFFHERTRERSEVLP